MNNELERVMKEEDEEEASSVKDVKHTKRMNKLKDDKWPIFGSPF